MPDPRIPTENECIAWEEFSSNHWGPYNWSDSVIESADGEAIAMANCPRTARVICAALALVAPWMEATAKAYRDAVPEEVWKEMNRKLEIGLRKVYEDEIARYAGTYRQWINTPETKITDGRPDLDEERVDGIEDRL